MQETKHNRIKKWLLVIIWSSVLVFTLQYNLKIFKERELGGNSIKKPDVQFTFDGWFSGEFQKSYEDWYNENFGFAKTLVRFNNQILYSCLGVSHAEEVIVGKKGHLFY